MVMSKLMRMTSLAIVMLGALGPLPAWAALQAYVDRNPVSENESFTLTTVRLSARLSGRSV
jgi:hypothetical protein